MGATRCSHFAGPDCPDGFIGNDDGRPILHNVQYGFELVLNKSGRVRDETRREVRNGIIGLTSFKRLAATKNDIQSMLQSPSGF
jgi:hypothetical protein